MALSPPRVSSVLAGPDLLSICLENLLGGGERGGGGVGVVLVLVSNFLTLLSWQR